MLTFYRHLHFISLSLFILFIFACSSGDDAPVTDNPGSLLQGVLLNFQGVEYSSDGETGVTGTNGSFNYKAGATIKFYIGDILIGEIPAQAIVTTVDLVPGAIDETNIVAFNIYRCLLSLDSDNNLTNGVQIAETTRNNAVGQSIDFNQTETNFEASAKIVVADLVNSNDPETALVPATLARDELRSSLLGLYLGYYEGTFSGDDTGTWALTVDSNGNIVGDGFSNNDSASFTLSGTVGPDGNGQVSSGNVSTGATFSGVFSRDGIFSGTWENIQFAESGTFSGNTTTSPDSGNGGGTNTGGTITTDPNLMAGVSIFNTVTSDFATYDNANIAISAPDIAENGAVVPLTVTFPSKSGSLWIFSDINDEKIAAKADYLVPNDNGFLSIRIKMKQTGNIIAVFEDGNGVLTASQKQIKVTIGSVPEACTVADCTPAFSGTIIRARDSAGTFKLLASNAMNTEDYISTITVSFNGVPNTVVYFTSFVSKNPYLSIKHAMGIGIEVNVDVQATGNRSTSATILTN